MDAMHPIRRPPAIRQAAAAGQFGALIRVTRTFQRLTLVQAGRLIGYSASTLSRIETGHRKLTGAQQFYGAFGGTCAGRAMVSPPRGAPARLNGSPHKSTWPDASSPACDVREAMDANRARK